LGIWLMERLVCIWKICQPDRWQQI
jgi:hypothetical protein